MVTLVLQQKMVSEQKVYAPTPHLWHRTFRLNFRLYDMGGGKTFGNSQC